MIKKLTFTFVFCAVSSLTVSAQNTIESIRKTYQEVHQWISQMTLNADGETEMPPEYFDLRVVQNLPGTGPHHEDIRMFYGEEAQEFEGEDFNPYPTHYLRFVTAKYNFAAREFYEEYLYDEKGNVMFIYVLTPDVEAGEMIPYELRMWLDGKRLLRFTAKKVEGPLDYIDLATLRKTAFREVYSGTAIPDIYQAEADRCRQRAQRFLTMFAGIDGNTYY